MSMYDGATNQFKLIPLSEETELFKNFKEEDFSYVSDCNIHERDHLYANYRRITLVCTKVKAEGIVTLVYKTADPNDTLNKYFFTTNEFTANS